MATRNRTLADFASQVTSGSNFDSVSINSLLYPLQDGLSGQFITTNGSGTLSFIDGGLDSALVTGMVDAAYVQSRADSAYITGIVDSAYVLLMSGGGGGASVTTDTTAPVSPSDGDLWYDEESGFLFLYYTDINTSQWVQVGGGGGGGGAGLTESDGNYYAFDSAGVTGQFRVGQTTTALGGIQVDPAGYIDIKNNGDSASYINLYCEVNNAHYAKLQSGAHADYSGNATITLPTTTTTLAGLDIAQSFTQAQTFAGSTTFTGTASFNGDVNLGNATSDTITFNGTPSFSDITATGTVTAANFVSTSDRRLKDNIETISDPINKIKQLRGVTFDKDDRTQIGVIAQEVEEIIPEVVLTAADGYKSVAYGNIVALLIEAVKEQQTQIEKLKQQLENR